MFNQTYVRRVAFRAILVVMVLSILAVGSWAALERKWMQNATVAVESTTGALLVQLDGAGGVTAAISPASVTALGGGKTTADVWTRLGSPAQDCVLSASYRVTLGASDTLPNLIAATLPANLARLAIIPESSNAAALRWKIGGAASATTPEWPLDGHEVPITKTVADTIRLFGSAGDYATVEVFVPRN